MDYPADQVVGLLDQVGITHVVWLPDSALGPWEHALEQASQIELVRVCREGEAWALAAGLHLGGRRPLVMIQNTGLFESGDSLRNVLFDLKLPLAAVVGYRSALIEGSTDSARLLTEPVLTALGIDYVVIRSVEELPRLAAHLEHCRQVERPGMVLLAEGRM